MTVDRGSDSGESEGDRDEVKVQADQAADEGIWKCGCIRGFFALLCGSVTPT